MSEPAEQRFSLPDVGEGLTEAEIVTWRVAVGDTVKVNEVLVEIETAKSVVELPSPFAGVVTALLVEEGATVPVGTPIIAIDAAAGGSESAAKPDREPTLVGYGARQTGARRRRKVPMDLGTVVHLHSGADDHGHRRVRVKPPVRKLAKDLGVNIEDVPASGPVITRADVEAFAATRAPAAAATAVEPEPEAAPPAMTPSVTSDVRVPVRGVRKAMAEAMVRSVRTAPHATEWLTVDVTRTVDLVNRLRRDPAFEGVRVMPTVIVAKAVCLAMRHTPMLNATWIDAVGDQPAEVLMHGSINLGVAVATDRGLVVPNVRSAERRSMVELARELDRMIALAREGRIQPEDQAGGTFTVTNIGALGVDAGTPILNLGESGILAVGAIQKRPWVADDDTVVSRWVTTLALSFDHRVVDGAEAARFLVDVGDIMRDPATALTY